MHLTLTGATKVTVALPCSRAPGEGRPMGSAACLLHDLQTPDPASSAGPHILPEPEEEGKQVALFAAACLPWLLFTRLPFGHLHINWKLEFSRKGHRNGFTVHFKLTSTPWCRLVM